ncbi:MAG: DnaB-like helicase C-terminal domain-containing protein [Francisellaceae bacterium]
MADHLNRYDCSSVQIAEVIIGKHRNGAIGHVNLTFRGELCRFENHINDFEYL